MPELETLSYLESQLAEQIAGFDDSRKWFRKQQFRFTMATALLSTLTTIFIGVGQILGWQPLSIVSLICSASITVLAAWDQHLRSKELWVQKTDTWMALQNLEAHINYAKAKFGVSLTQQQIDKFYARFDEIIMNEHNSWKKVRTTQESRPTAAEP